MATKVEKSRTDSELLDDPRRVLVDRVAASESFAKSPRLRELLLYLAECALRDPPAPLTEQQIGVAIFNRPAGYDTSYDTVVRVQASEVRKRIKYYFLSEGLQEPILMELPKGSYLPVFSPRKPPEGIEDVPSSDEEIRAPIAAALAPAEAAAVLDRLPRVPPVRLERPTRLINPLLTSLLVVAVALCGWLAYDNAQLRGGSPKTPFLDHFWKQFFQNGKQTDVVPSDFAVMTLADVLRRTVSLREYSDRAYPKPLLDPLIPDPVIRPFLDRPATAGSIAAHDLPLLHTLSLLSARYRVPFKVISPTKFLPDSESRDNVILLGHKRANPWVEMFESRMNFRHVYDDDLRKGMIVNQSPGSGEQLAYTAERYKANYAVVACLPRPGGGSALLLFSAPLVAVDGAGRLVTNEAAMAELHSRLGVSLSGRLPYFEVLLEKKATARTYEIVAHRIIKDR